MEATVQKQGAVNLNKTRRMMGESTGGWVYCVSHNDKYFKIGITKSHPEKRLYIMQTGNPIELKIKWAVKVNAPKITESLIHSYWNTFRHRGEWFKLPYGEDEIIKNYIETGRLYNQEVI